MEGVQRVGRCARSLVHLLNILQLQPDAAAFSQLVAVAVQQNDCQFAFAFVDSFEQQTFPGVLRAKTVPKIALKQKDTVWVDCYSVVLVGNGVVEHALDLPCRRGLVGKVIVSNRHHLQRDKC